MIIFVVTELRSAVERTEKDKRSAIIHSFHSADNKTSQYNTATKKSVIQPWRKFQEGRFEPFVLFSSSFTFIRPVLVFNITENFWDSFHFKLKLSQISPVENDVCPPARAQGS